jgi:hypothetical protein
MFSYGQRGAGFLTELEEDVAEECCKLGPITRLKVFGQHPAGEISQNRSKMALNSITKHTI